MRRLFDHWDKIEQKIRRTKHVFLCTDFDGTIAPIKPRPRQARLTEDTRKLLYKISRAKKFSLGIISGRSLKDIKKKVGLRGIIYAGNHGLEITYSKKRFIYPAAKKYVPIISAAAAGLKENLLPFPGAVLEDKTFSLSLHYRLVKGKRLAGLKKRFLQIVEPYLSAGELKLTSGKKVWELRPPINWNKGKALLWLVQRLGKPLAIFMGDDLTDEDAFRAVNKIGGVSILIGRRLSSAAQYSLGGTRQTQAFLRKICEG